MNPAAESFPKENRMTDEEKLKMFSKEAQARHRVSRINRPMFQEI